MNQAETDLLVEHHHSRPVPGSLWFALFAGMVAFAIEEQLSYVLTYNACSTGRFWLVHLVTVCTLALAAIGLVIGLVQFRLLSKGGDAARYEGRDRFIAISAIALDVGFIIAIIATAVPKTMLSPCS
jgi:hypothetical protein